MRCTKVALMFSLVLGLSQGLFAAVADWAEEMDVLPFASTNAWLPAEGNWGDTVAQGPGTWINNTNNGNIYTQGNPTADLLQYTIEYKFRFTSAVPQGSGLVVGALLYNAGAGGDENDQTIGRTRNSFGYMADGDADLNFEVVGAGGNRHNPIDIGLFGVNDWQTIRVVFDSPSMTMYLNNNPTPLAVVFSDPAGGTLMVGEDTTTIAGTAGLAIGASDGGGNVDVEWDYVRIKTGVVSINEPLNAVPEPSSFALLGLAGLALLRRRS